VRLLEPDVGLTLTDTTDPFEITGPKPLQRKHTFFTNDSGNMVAGVWDSTAMVSKMRPFPTHEFVQMLEGQVTITETDGTAQTFVAGDCFFVPKGTVCSWEIKNYVKKYFAILDA